MATSTNLGLRPSFAVVPLLSSSIAVFYALMEPTLFIPWLRYADTDLAATNRALRIWFTHFRTYSAPAIPSITTPTVVAGCYALVKLPSYSPEWKLYAAGTAFTLGHFLFVPTAAEALDKICDECTEKSNGNVEWLKNWLRIHAWRTVLTDIPAAICFGWLVFGS